MDARAFLGTNPEAADPPEEDFGPAWVQFYG